MAIGARHAFEEITDTKERDQWLSPPLTGCEGVPKVGQNWVRQGPPPLSLIAEPLVPQISLRFFGLALMLNQPPKALLGEGDSIFVTKEGDIVNRRYRILRIDSNFLLFEDLIEKSVHELALSS
jgi:hypothetical protein